MAIAKRILLFLAVNILVVVTVSLILNFFNIQPYLTKQGLNYSSLMAFCLIWGMVGAFISLLLSKMMAKWMMGVTTIDPLNCSDKERKLFNMVQDLSRKAGLHSVPEVGIFESPELNAFATGPTQSRSLVAFSSGLLEKMSQEEIEGVAAHELAHIANGDMVTMTLVQGVINAFVMFLARVVAFAILQMRGSSDGEESETVSSLAYMLTTLVLEVIFMILGSIVVAWFSRHREFHADRGGAAIAGKHKMVAALQALKKHYEDPVGQTVAEKAPSMRAMMISSKGESHRVKLFASHPSLDTRIDRLNGHL